MHVAFAPVLMIMLNILCYCFTVQQFSAVFVLPFLFPLAFGSLTAGKSLDILMAMSLGW